jgi:predicted nucleic acid-binding protein
VIYLVDKSAWEQLRYSEAARAMLRAVRRSGDIAICPAIAGELLFSARSGEGLVTRRRQLETLLWLETTDDAQHRALGVQQDLSRHGHHRGVGLVDLLVAATAEEHQATVLHYDSDFERIAKVTGQPHEWIVPHGEGHSRGEGQSRGEGHRSGRREG